MCLCDYHTAARHQLNEHPSTWSIDVVAHWAECSVIISLEDIQKLRAEKIDGAVLLHMTDIQHFKACGLAYGPASKLARAVEKLKSSSIQASNLQYLIKHSCLTVNSILSCATGFLRRQLPSIIRFLLQNRQKIKRDPGTQDILTISGPRRCGKTVMCHQIIHQLVEEGTPKEKIFFLDLDHCSIPEGLVEQLFGLCFDSGFEYIILDEIHCTDEIVTALRVIQDAVLCNAPFQLVLTGSKADLFQDLPFATKLVGRTANFDLLPFSYPEFVAVTKSMNFRDPLAEYLFWGGFPKVIFTLCNKGPKDAQTVLGDIIRDIVNKDLMLDGGIIQVADAVQKLFESESIHMNKENKALIDALLRVKLLVQWSQDSPYMVVDTGLLNAYLRSSNDYRDLHPQSLATAWTWHLQTQNKKIHFPPGLIAVNDLQRYVVIQTNSPPTPPFIDLLTDSCARLFNRRPIDNSILMVIGLDNAAELLLCSWPPQQLGYLQNLALLVVPAADTFHQQLLQFPKFSQFQKKFSALLNDKSNQLAQEYSKRMHRYRSVDDGCC